MLGCMVLQEVPSTAVKMVNGLLEVGLRVLKLASRHCRLPLGPVNSIVVNELVLEDNVSPVLPVKAPPVGTTETPMKVAKTKGIIPPAVLFSPGSAITSTTSAPAKNPVILLKKSPVLERSPVTTITSTTNAPAKKPVILRKKPPVLERSPVTTITSTTKAPAKKPVVLLKKPPVLQRNPVTTTTSDTKTPAKSQSFCPRNHQFWREAQYILPQLK
ncbi:unnamed protein product [Orchesella dallaii]|uniref:Uncharacterized protein n=1 Tax=Orchesella dallaii TaxID=48710 RepID=A0ABP1RHC3_9HEXA